jgi:O-acetyl-ADP-ribose deacetylase (regulator of RNase III)
MNAKSIKIEFVDRNVEVIQAYANFFSKKINVKLKIDDILKQESGALVSPANCYGNMDGGIDKAYNTYFSKMDLESEIMHYIDNFHGGKLEIGSAQIIPTNDDKFKYVIFSPTVERPGEVAKPENIEKLMYSVIKEVTNYNKKFSHKNKLEIDKLLIPGLGTGYGNLEPRISAEYAKKGYEKAIISNFE